MRTATRTLFETTSPLAINTTMAYYLLFIGLGMVSASAGPALTSLSSLTNSTLGATSYVFAARSIGFFLGSFLVGRAYDRLPAHPIVVAMLLIMAGAMLFIPGASSLWLLIVAMLFIGLSQGSVDVGGNTLIVWVHRAKVGPFMNGLHLVWGIGAFLSPLLIAQALAYEGSIRLAFWLIAFSLLPIAYWIWSLPSPQPIVQEEISTQDLQNRRWPLFLIVAFYFMYIAAEVSISGWFPAYAVHLGLASEVNAAYLNSVFFGSLTLARIVAIPLALRFRSQTILYADLSLSLLTILIMLLFPTWLYSPWIGAAGLGIGLASIFPTMLDFAQEYLTISGKITSWIFMGASAGGTITPWLIGQLFEPVGPRIVVWVLLGSMLACVAILYALISTKGIGNQEHAI